MPNEKPLSSAFLTGLFMGLAAPALLLTNAVQRPMVTIAETLAGDWHRVGGDLRAATQRVARRTPGLDKRAA